MTRYLLVGAAALILGACATTSGPSGDVWMVTRDADPITGIERCIVVAADRGGRGSFTRTGYLYPFVESNSDVGLLVGVSSGGRYRLPPGDIVWRVDQNPHRTIRAAATPSFGESQADAGVPPGMPPSAVAVYQMSQAMASGTVSSIANGITAAGGDEARELLAEMRAGSELLFRSSRAAPSAGVPSMSNHLVGQMSGDELRPYALDASFETGLAACGLE